MGEGELGDGAVAWVSLHGGGEGRMDAGHGWGGVGRCAGGGVGGSMGGVGEMVGGLDRLAAWRGRGVRSCVHNDVERSC